MSDLLPNNATPQEDALDDAAARIGDVPVLVREVWNPETCPSAALPWLAWALSVDAWDPAWTDEQKRETIASAIEVQRIKGTIGAVRAALGALGVEARVLEWHRQQTPGSPYTYKLFFETEQVAARQADIEQAVDIVDRTKSLRSHLAEIQVGAASKAGPTVVTVATTGHETAVSFKRRGALVNEAAAVCTPPAVTTDTALVMS